MGLPSGVFYPKPWPRPEGVSEEGFGLGKGLLTHAEGVGDSSVCIVYPIVLVSAIERLEGIVLS